MCMMYTFAVNRRECLVSNCGDVAQGEDPRKLGCEGLLAAMMSEQLQGGCLLCRLKLLIGDEVLIPVLMGAASSDHSLLKM